MLIVETLVQKAGGMRPEKRWLATRWGMSMGEAGRVETACRLGQLSVAAQALAEGGMERVTQSGTPPGA